MYVRKQLFRDRVPIGVFGKKCWLSGWRREGTGCKFPLVLPTADLLQFPPVLSVSPQGLLCSLVLIALGHPSPGPGSFPALSCSRTWALLRELWQGPELSSFSDCPREWVAPFLAAPLPRLLSLSHLCASPSSSSPCPAPCAHSSEAAAAWAHSAGHHWAQSCLRWFLPEEKNPAGYQLDLKQFHWIYCGLNVEP